MRGSNSAYTERSNPRVQAATRLRHQTTALATHRHQQQHNHPPDRHRAIRPNRLHIRHPSPLPVMGLLDTPQLATPRLRRHMMPHRRHLRLRRNLQRPRNLPLQPKPEQMPPRTPLPIATLVHHLGITRHLPSHISPSAAPCQTSVARI